MRSPMSVELQWQAVPLYMPTGTRDEAAHESNQDAVDGDVVEWDDHVRQRPIDPFFGSKLADISKGWCTSFCSICDGDLDWSFRVDYCIHDAVYRSLALKLQANFRHVHLRRSCEAVKSPRCLICALSRSCDAVKSPRCLIFLPVLQYGGQNCTGWRNDLSLHAISSTVSMNSLTRILPFSPSQAPPHNCTSHLIPTSFIYLLALTLSLHPDSSGRSMKSGVPSGSHVLDMTGLYTQFAFVVWFAFLVAYVPLELCCWVMDHWSVLCIYYPNTCGAGVMVRWTKICGNSSSLCWEYRFERYLKID